MNKIISLASIVFLTLINSCLFEPDEKEYIQPFCVDSVKVTHIVDRKATFECIGWVGDLCWEHDHTEIDYQNTDYFVQIIIKRDESLICPQDESLTCPDVISKMTIPVSITIGQDTSYTFHFWQSDSTSLDTTITFGSSN